MQSTCVTDFGANPVVVDASKLRPAPIARHGCLFSARGWTGFGGSSILSGQHGPIVDSKLTCPVYVAHDLSGVPSAELFSGALECFPSPWV